MRRGKAQSNSNPPKPPQTPPNPPNLNPPERKRSNTQASVKVRTTRRKRLSTVEASTPAASSSAKPCSMSCTSVPKTRSSSVRTVAKWVLKEKKQIPVLVQKGEHVPFFLVFTGGSLLWMDRILHFEIMRTHCLSVFTGESSETRDSEVARNGFRPSTVVLGKTHGAACSKPPISGWAAPTKDTPKALLKNSVRSKWKLFVLFFFFYFSSHQENRP